MELAPSPLLVAAAVATPDLHSGAIGGARPGYVEAETGPDPHDGAVGVESPLLVAAAVTVPDLHSGARRRGKAWHVEALVAIHLQFPVGQRGPLLVATPVTVPDLQQRAVGGGRPWHVQAAIGARTPQDPGRTATPATTAVTSRRDAGLDSVVGRVRRVARRHRAFEEGSDGAIAVVATNAQENCALLVHGVVPARARSIPHRGQAT